MDEFRIFHGLIVLAVVVIFFGGRRIPEIMNELGEGIMGAKQQPQPRPVGLSRGCALIGIAWYVHWLGQVPSG
jgi:hypothetical protein